VPTTPIAHWLRTQPSLLGTPPSFDVSSLPAAPVELFRTWIRQAADAGTPEPHASTLSTIGIDGVPDARTLILKDVDSRGWTVAGARSSAKGAQLAAHPVAALNFWWQPVRRAVRVRGDVVEATRAESAADLAARSPDAREGLSDGEWVVWRIRPRSVEFWQGATDRRHVRVLYECTGGEWGVRRLDEV
jgi:pyridoxamine 5'-phosphate oxidase